MDNIIKATEKYSDLILKAERYIWDNPETGYKEFKTSDYMEKAFKALGYKLTKAEGLTGFYTVIDTGRPGPEVLVLGELDSVICPSHPDSDEKTGAVHACGHNAQCAALLGVAAVLTEKDVLKNLCGRIRLCAVPAEELLEIEYRQKLKNEGKIKYFGGKTEFMRRGYFDGVDLALMVHTSAGKDAIIRKCVGCLAKKIIYKGVASHAGGSPWNGRNALYAATCGINAVNAIRETFKENDVIRVHPIITHGGEIVNAIPEKVELEAYVRGSSFKGMKNANDRINQALIGAALSIDTNVEIIDIPGYAPLNNDDGMIKIAIEAGEAVLPTGEVKMYEEIESSSTDMGDMSMVMPVVHPWCSGARGRAHGSNYEIFDPTSACINSTKWQVAIINLLLKDGAARAKEILDNFTPDFPSFNDYLSFLDSLNSSGDRITYNDGEATVKL